MCFLWDYKLRLSLKVKESGNAAKIYRIGTGRQFLLRTMVDIRCLLLFACEARVRRSGIQRIWYITTMVVSATLYCIVRRIVLL